MDKIQTKKSCSSRRRFNSQESSQDKKTKAIKKVQIKALNTSDLTKCLSNSPHFLGVFSSDQLLLLRFKTFPISFIINLEPKSSNGSHWLSIWIDNHTIEVFDSLGLNPQSWKCFPRRLFQFLSRFKYSHEFKISPACQSINSHYCGLFCIYFICKRPFWTFETCCSNLKSANYTRSFRKACNFVLE